jgi:hypothetical protein
MKLSDLKPIQQKLELHSPKDDSPLGIFLDVVGPDSKQVRDIERQLQKEGIARGKAGSEVEIEEVESILIKKFAAAIVGWDSAYDEAMEGPYSPEYAVTLLTEYRWIADAVAGYVSNRQHFFR